MRSRIAIAIAAFVLGTASAAPAEQDGTVGSPTAVHEQTARHLQEVVDTLSRLGTPERPFDFLSPAVSGPVVVLRGFTNNGALKDDAVESVKKLKWVVHVVDEIEYLDSGPELRRMRTETLATLQKMVPQAFPESHANIRIKVTKEGDVTLVGIVGPHDKKRLEAAVEQIKHIELVKSVTNHIVETTG